MVGIFTVAGLSKLVDPTGSRKAVTDFGVPASLASVAAVILPVVEIVIAAFLLFPSVSWFGAIGSAALLTLFLAGMVYQMVQGNAPDCHCFGQLHSEPIGKSSLIRNLIFLIPAVVLIYKGRVDQGLSLTNIDRDSLQLILVLIAVLLLGFAIDLLRRISAKQDNFARRIEVMELISKDGAEVERQEAGNPRDGLPMGAPLPDFVLADARGGTFSTGMFAKRGRPALFFFVSPTCNPCQALVPELDSWQAELDGKVDIILVSSGKPKENLQKFEGERPKHILLDEKREFAESVKAKWTPGALFVGASGKVASDIATGDVEIRKLVERIKSEDLSSLFTYFANGKPNDLGVTLDAKIGEIVPEFSIKDLRGKEVDAGFFRGKPTLVAFWSPTCPHCRGMIGDLKEWESSKGEDEPNLLVFSDGDPQENLDLGLDAPVILEAEYVTASKFGMFGTPSAVLVNEDGRFASELAIGAPDIWALIGRKK